MGNKTEFDTRNGREMGNDTEFETRNWRKWETRREMGVNGKRDDTRYIIFAMKNEKNREKTGKQGEKTQKKQEKTGKKQKITRNTETRF